jgi:hypothetical protein
MKAMLSVGATERAAALVAHVSSRLWDEQPSAEGFAAELGAMGLREATLVIAPVERNKRTLSVKADTLWCLPYLPGTKVTPAEAMAEAVAAILPELEELAWGVDAYGGDTTALNMSIRNSRVSDGVRA